MWCNVELCWGNYINIFGINRPPARNLFEFDNFINQNILNLFDFNIDLLDPSNRELEIISNLFRFDFKYYH